MWAPSRVLEPPFRAGVGSSLHLPSLSFSAEHALAKEKGFRNPMPPFLLVYSQYSHHLVLIAISPFHMRSWKSSLAHSRPYLTQQTRPEYSLRSNDLTAPSLLVLIFHVYFHCKQVTEKKTAGHGQKTWSPDELVTPASVSFHDSRLVHFWLFFSLLAARAYLWNSWSSAGMLLKGLCFDPMFKEICPPVFKGVGPGLKAHEEWKTRQPSPEILL
ncbi:hypothetical protein DKX38_013083 [Salix brachista]|uniref:Uncharacterized protein n=1 Tax=Salix brachista TaxID=2182728 RepID=A0A5N5LS43_9ROSI|nr:hypothetical protein DKX38_013083 [Salix brachista]